MLNALLLHALPAVRQSLLHGRSDRLPAERPTHVAAAAATCVGRSAGRRSLRPCSRLCLTAGRACRSSAFNMLLEPHSRVPHLARLLRD